MNRRSLLHSAIPAAAGLAMATCARRHGLVLPPLQSLAGWAGLLAAGKMTIPALTEHFLHRIRTLDQAGPLLRAVVEVNPDALIIANRLGQQTQRGLLHGIPVLVKDNMDTADSMETTAGCLALLGGRRPERDATVITRLRGAGAVLLGKTNLSEWANIRSPNSTSGWSARGGLTLNPHHPGHSASGSSTGSAVAVAAGFATAAIGTETNGSIVSPASACGIVGLKPTTGLVSRAGIIPITRWQDTAGPMTLTVWDAALVLNVIAGVDARDGFTTAAAGHICPDYTAGLTAKGLRGKRLGILRAECGSHPGVLALFDRALNHLREAGAEIVDNVDLPHEQEAGRLAWQCMLTELRQDLNGYLEQRAAGVSSLAEVITYNEDHRAQEMPYFGQEFFERAQLRGTPEAIAEATTLRAEARRIAGPLGLDASLRAHALDALICPTNDPEGTVDLTHGDTENRVACTPAAVAGYPHLTVPMGLVDGLPVGLSFMGTAWSEQFLLACGHAFEQVMPARPTPTWVV